MSEQRSNPLLELTLWRVREFLREPEAVFWVFAFPVLLAFALGLAFRNKGPEEVRVGVLDGPGAPAVVEALERSAVLEAVVLDSAEARNQLRTGRVSVLVLPSIWSIATTAISSLEEVGQWLDLDTVTRPLFSGEMAGQDWAQLATGVSVWVLLPLAIGTWRVLRREVK